MTGDALTDRLRRAIAGPHPTADERTRVAEADIDTLLWYVSKMREEIHDAETKLDLMGAPRGQLTLRGRLEWFDKQLNEACDAIEKLAGRVARMAR